MLCHLPCPLWNQFKAHAQKLKKDTGNVLFIILLAVALFAALAYAVTQSTRSGGGDASRESHVLLASQITQYGTELQNAIMRMKISNGCTDTQISFENSIISGYQNNDAPADYRCHVFRPEGGNVVYKIPPVGVNQMGATIPNVHTHSDRLPYVFSGDHCSIGIGTDGAVGDCRAQSSAMELIVYVPVFSLDLCNEINRKLGNGLSSPSVATGYWCGGVATTCYGKFVGASTYRTFYGDLPAGQYSACVQAGSAGQNVFPRYTGNIYFYYHVLIAR